MTKISDVELSRRARQSEIEWAKRRRARLDRKRGTVPSKEVRAALRQAIRDGATDTQLITAIETWRQR